MQNKRQRTSELSWLLKRFIFLGIISVLISFVVLVLFGVMEITETMDSLRYDDEKYMNVNVQYYTEQLTLNYPYMAISLEVLCILFGGIGFGSALVMFNHLFSRKQSMMMAALPVSKTKDFLYRIASYMILVVTPIVICLGVYPIIVRLNGLRMYFDTALYLKRSAAILMINLYGFSVGLMSACICGTFWSAIISGILTICSTEGIFYGWRRFASYYLRTMIADRTSDVLKTFSPVVTLYKGAYTPGEFNWVPGTVAMILIIMLALYAYKRNKPENAGYTMNFNSLHIPVTLWAILIGATAGGFIFTVASARERSLYIGIAFGSAVAYIIVRMLLEQNIRISLKTWYIPIICTVLFSLACFTMKADLFGYDSWSPDRDQIKAIEYTYNYNAPYEKVRFTEKETVDAAYDWTNLLHQEAMTKRENRQYSTYHSRDIKIVYEMNGKTVGRSYARLGNQEDAIPYLKRMAQSSELWDKYFSNDTEDIYIYSRIPTYGLNDTEFKEKYGFEPYWDITIDMKRLVPALKQDLKERTLEDMQKPVVCNIYYSNRINVPNSNKYQYIDYTMPVTVSDTNILTKLFGEDAEKIISYLKGGFLESGEYIAFENQFEDETGKNNDSRLLSDPQDILEAYKNTVHCNDPIYSYPTNGTVLKIIAKDALHRMEENGEIERIDWNNTESLNVELLPFEYYNESAIKMNYESEE